MMWVLVYYPFSTFDVIHGSDGNVALPYCQGANDTIHAMYVLGSIREIWGSRPTHIPAWSRRILVPWPFNRADLDLPQYYRSYSAYVYYDSYGQYVVAGEVNPGFDGIILVDSEDVFRNDTFQVDYYEYEVLRKLDSVVDFNDYDLDGDCVVDNASILMTVPIYRFGEPALNLPVAAYYTNDVCGSSFVRIVRSSGITLGYGAPDNITNVVPYYRAVSMPLYEWFQILCVGSKYDRNSNDSLNWESCRLSNPAIRSLSVGHYSQVVPTATVLPRPSSPYDKIVMQREGYYRRVKIVSITSSGTYVFEDHATTGKIYHIPISSREYFLITNHQKLSRVEDVFRGEGLLIWHIRENYPMSYVSEKKKKEDLESAFGMWDYRGKDYGEDPERGYDNLDFGLDTVYVPACYSYYVRKSIGDASYGYASPYDFFNEENKTVFDHLSNPSSDAYNDLQAYYVTFPGDSCFEDSGVWLPGACITDTIIRPDPEDPSRKDTIYAGHLWWDEAQELNVPQNIATHIAIRNIRKEGGVGPNMVAEVYVNYVQSDDSIATGPSTSPKLAYGGGRLHMVYTSRGYVYHTSTVAPPWRWDPAYPVDRGGDPAVAFSPSGEVCAVWTSGREVRFNCGGADYYSWTDNTTLFRSSAIERPKAPSLTIDPHDTVHVVFEVKGLTTGSRLLYGKFYKGDAGSVRWQVLDRCGGVPPIRTLPAYSPYGGPSITLTNTDRPFVVWTCRDTVRYTYRDLSGWAPVMGLSEGEAPSVSSNGTDTVILSYLRDREVKARYYATVSSTWSPETTLDDSAFAPTASYPFVGWVRVKGDDWCDICRVLRVSYLDGSSWSSPVDMGESNGYMDYVSLQPMATYSGTRLHAVVSRYDGRAYEVARTDTLFAGMYLSHLLSAGESGEVPVRIAVSGDEVVIYGADRVKVEAYNVAGRRVNPTLSRGKGFVKATLKGLPRGVYMYVLRIRGERRILKVVKR